VKKNEYEQVTIIEEINDTFADEEGKANACPPCNKGMETDNKADTTKREEPIPISEAAKQDDTPEKSGTYDNQPSSLQENIQPHKSKQTDKPEPNKKSSLPVEPDKLFLTKAEDAGIMIDCNGICVDRNGETEYVSNIRRIEYLHTVLCNGDPNNRVRVVKINDTVAELYPEHLTSLNKFKKLLLGQGNTSFNGETKLYQKLVNLILALDNGKTVEMLDGFGKVHPEIYHLGNKIIIDGETKPYQEILWSGNNGVKLEKSGKLRIESDAHKIEDIWDRLNETYPEYSYVITGFAVATLFFDTIIKDYGSFPILYIAGKSGSGKTKMAEIISNMLGCDTDMFTVNCDSLSTRTGVDEKNQSLNNLPLILNELDHKWYPLLKSRFDGEGAIKSCPTKQYRTLQRQVKGSTIVTSVNRPLDSQVISRSVFIDTSKMKRNLDKFPDLYHNRRKLSQFIVSSLGIKSHYVISEIKRLYDIFKGESIEPRIISNYAIIAGALSAFAAEYKIADCNGAKLTDFFKKEMIEAEKGLDPVYHLVGEIRSLIDEQPEQDFLLCDDEFVYIHIEGLWQYLPPGVKDQYYRKQEAKDVKTMLANSEYVARYGGKFSGPEGKPVISLSKKINNATKRCIVLIRDKL